MTRHQAISIPVSCAMTLAVPFLAASLAAQSGARQQDRDVKQIIEEVDRARDRFEDQLDGKIKSSVIRGTTGEVNVERYLDDLQDNVKKLKERFTPQYAASKEAETVLRQGSDIHTYIRSLGQEFKGRSEWDTLSASLGRLGAAYQTTFPVPPDAPVRRLNDAEVAKTADELAKGADEFKKQIDQEKDLPPPVRSAAKKDLDALIKQAKAVKARASDSKPGTAEARSLFESVQKISSFVQAQPSLLPGTLSAWGAMTAPLDMLQRAYGLRTPVPEP
jgi:hypothetical protein